MDSKIKEKVAASVTSVEQQGFIKITSLLGWSLNLTFDNLREACPGQVLSRRQIGEWRRRFFSGQVSSGDETGTSLSMDSTSCLRFGKRSSE